MSSHNKYKSYNEVTKKFFKKSNTSIKIQTTNKTKFFQIFCDIFFLSKRKVFGLY